MAIMLEIESLAIDAQKVIPGQRHGHHAQPRFGETIAGSTGLVGTSFAGK